MNTVVWFVERHNRCRITSAWKPQHDPSCHLTIKARLTDGLRCKYRFSWLAVIAKHENVEISKHVKVMKISIVNICFIPALLYNISLSRRGSF